MDRIQDEQKGTPKSSSDMKTVASAGGSSLARSNVSRKSNLSDDTEEILDKEELINRTLAMLSELIPVVQAHNQKFHRADLPCPELDFMRKVKLSLEVLWRKLRDTGTAPDIKDNMVRWTLQIENRYKGNLRDQCMPVCHDSIGKLRGEAAQGLAECRELMQQMEATFDELHVARIATDTTQGDRASESGDK